MRAIIKAMLIKTINNQVISLITTGYHPTLIVTSMYTFPPLTMTHFSSIQINLQMLIMKQIQMNIIKWVIVALQMQNYA